MHNFQFSKLVARRVARVTVLILGTGESPADMRAELNTLPSSDVWYHYWRAMAWLVICASSAAMLLSAAVLGEEVSATLGSIVAAISWGILIGSAFMMVLYGCRVSAIGGKNFLGQKSRYTLAIEDGPIDLALFVLVAAGAALFWVS